MMKLGLGGEWLSFSCVGQNRELKKLGFFFFFSECENGYYGDDCKEKCGQCLHGQPCDKQKGKCLRGCQPNFLSPFCKGSILNW